MLDLGQEDSIFTISRVAAASDAAIRMWADRGVTTLSQSPVPRHPRFAVRPNDADAEQLEALWGRCDGAASQIEPGSGRAAPGHRIGKGQ
ncbi:MAG: hypothetical protein H0T46_06380 [Deltaproteobacteria bacterium]|nr:hypothetical protein [Deltaproteobacteria bacterium]